MLLCFRIFGQNGRKNASNFQHIWLNSLFSPLRSLAKQLNLVWSACQGCPVYVGFNALQYSVWLQLQGKL